MVKNKKVSVIVPVYNAGPYIEACVDSLLGQSWKDIEVIIIDDGSQDRSWEIISGRYGGDPRIVCVRKANEGVSAARNTGLSLASGDFITFVDADDWVDRDFVKNAMLLMEQYQLDLILGGTVKVYQDHCVKCCAGREKPIWVYDDLRPVRYRVLSNGCAAPELKQCFTSGAVCRIFRRSVIGTVKFDPTLAIGEDTVFNMAVLERAERMGITGECWYYYRMHADSATSKLRGSIEQETKKLIQVLYQIYGSREEYGDYLAVRAVQQFHGMLLLNVLHKESPLSFAEKRRYIADCLRKSPWNEVFACGRAGNLPAGSFDRILFYLCRKKRVLLIMVLIRMRLRAKALINYLRK